MKTLLFILLLSTSLAHAEPMAQIETNGTRVVLYTEPCALPVITNLPLRAEWTARGKTFAGCWALNQFSLIVMFFDDSTAVTIPAQLFSKVTSI